MLSETNNVISDHSNTANSDHAKIEYGGIVNLAVRRKDRKGSKMASATNPTKMHFASQKPVPSIPPTSSQLKNKASGSPSSSQGTSKSSGQKSSMSGTKARGSIMQTFAKAAESKRTQAPQLVQAQATESSSPAMVSDDDGEDGHSQILPLPKASAGGAAAQKARSGREEELRRMMEDDDESGAEEARNSFNGRRAEPSPNSEVIGAGDTAGQQGPGPGDSQPSELVSISGDGRKRGKRKIIKKRQVQDDEGYFGKLTFYLPFVGLFSVWLIPNFSRQSRYGKQLGSPSRRTKRHGRRRPRRRRSLAQEDLRRLRNRHLKDRVA